MTYISMDIRLGQGNCRKMSKKVNFLYVVVFSGRYRSINEFIPHVKWLLNDPNNDILNCGCLQCLKLLRTASPKLSSKTKPLPPKRTFSPLKNISAVEPIPKISEIATNGGKAESNGADIDSNKDKISTSLKRKEVENSLDGENDDTSERNKKIKMDFEKSGNDIDHDDSTSMFLDHNNEKEKINLMLENFRLSSTNLVQNVSNLPSLENISKEKCIGSYDVEAAPNLNTKKDESQQQTIKKCNFFKFFNISSLTKKILVKKTGTLNSSTFRNSEICLIQTLLIFTESKPFLQFQNPLNSLEAFEINVNNLKENFHFWPIKILKTIANSEKGVSTLQIPGSKSLQQEKKQEKRVIFTSPLIIKNTNGTFSCECGNYLSNKFLKNSQSRNFVNCNSSTPIDKNKGINFYEVELLGFGFKLIVEEMDISPYHSKNLPNHFKFRNWAYYLLAIKTNDSLLIKYFLTLRTLFTAEMNQNTNEFQKNYEEINIDKDTISNQLNLNGNVGLNGINFFGSEIGEKFVPLPVKAEDGSIKFQQRILKFYDRVRVGPEVFLPGDVIKLKKGLSFNGKLYNNHSYLLLKRICLNNLEGSSEKETLQQISCVKQGFFFINTVNDVNGSGDSKLELDQVETCALENCLGRYYIFKPFLKFESSFEFNGNYCL
ncbi:hypothetical protein HK099_005091 [Clydaea vesicula]|uniref:Cryptic loci regulator 2 N-terminal domain-containing protein n=1 Tax=Clydaea vesicula TaxID=447962 RepID=A0AAD5XZT4_9FUNG|nr:hypothetical protein HK099_005091 [Clydaea vesicula]